MKMKGETERKSINLKFLVFGESRLGKTCLIERYVDGTFKDYNLRTI